MSTRSTIAYKFQDGATGVYCHWDGYPEGVGRILQEHYQDSYKIGILVSNGDISSLGPEIGKKHDFDDRKEPWTTYYGRDREEKNVACKQFDTVQDWVEHYTDAWCEYFYLWNGKEWLVSKNGAYTDKNGFPIFDRLEDVLERLEVA